jgi:acyl carrier protein
MNIEKRLKELIAKIARQDVNPDSINEETILTKCLGYDSIQIIELIVELENEFNIEIEDDDLEIENLTVYGKLYDMVKRKTKE